MLPSRTLERSNRRGRKRNVYSQEHDWKDNLVRLSFKDPNKFEEVTLREVELGGILVQSKDITESFLASAQKTSSPITHSAIFTYAIGKGDFPARSAAENPASRALIPESATEPEQTVAATREEVKAYLTRLADEGLTLQRAAVALAAYTGCRPGELQRPEMGRMESDGCSD
jgi:integrase